MCTVNDNKEGHAGHFTADLVTREEAQLLVLQYNPPVPL